MAIHQRRELKSIIMPAYVLLSSLTEMLKLSNSAVLIVKGNTIQIVATSADRSSYATLDTCISQLYDIFPWNPPDYALHLNLCTWIPRIYDHILLQPLSSLNIIKPLGSNNLQCEFDNPSPLSLSEQPPIDLGATHLVQENGIDIDDFHCKVKVGMLTRQLREGFEVFNVIPQCDEVRLGISTSGTKIRWAASSGHEMFHSVDQVYTCRSSTGSDLQLQFKRNWPLISVINSIVNCYGLVEISVLVDGQGMYWHHFSFLIVEVHMNSFNYMEKRPTED